MSRTEQKTELRDIKACVLHLSKKLNLINYPRKHCIFFVQRVQRGAKMQRVPRVRMMGTDGCRWVQTSA